MRKNKLGRKAGFNLAELMLVVAIIGILAAVGFIAVTRYLRIMKQFEYDNIAKEIFISAQNHLSMANNEGYLDRTDAGNQEGSTSVYYYVVNSSNSSVKGDLSDDNSLLNLILPVGAIEDSVRKNGSYIIRYDKNAARILDVFYSEQSGTQFGHSFGALEAEKGGSSSKPLMNLRGEDAKMDRRNYQTEANGRVSVVGYYGTESAKVFDGKHIDDPYLLIENVEQLRATVKIKDPTAVTRVVLVVKGKTSGQEKSITLTADPADPTLFKYVLDDITVAGKHFTDQFEGFIPGEDIVIYAEAMNNTALTNVGRTAKATTNSIFGDNSDTAEKKTDISNIRHLQNLDKVISKFDNSNLGFNKAEQSANLDWDDFKTKIYAADGKTSLTIQGFDGNDAKALTAADRYYPVQLPVNYDGTEKKISNVDILHTENAGLFSEIKELKVENLELIDFNVSTSGTDPNAGALAGTTSNATVSNVVAHEKIKDSSRKISSTGSAGGLIGHVAGSKIEECAAALRVSGAKAGGLIGQADNSTVDRSYAAGHTKDGKYIQDKIDVVSSSGYAGGLIAYSNATSIRNSYATTSVDGGNAAGGLVGAIKGKDSESAYSISNSYAVGYVKTAEEDNSRKGGLVGAEEGASSYLNCVYLTVANNSKLNAVGGKSEEVNGIQAADVASASKGSVQIYNEFLSADDTKEDASPYDAYLKKRYHYRNIEELSLAEPKLLKTHFGDWPLYETLVVNK